MAFPTQYFGRWLLTAALVVAWMTLAPEKAIAKDEEMACKLRPTIVPRSAEFSRSDVVVVKFLLANVGGAACTLPAELTPEGWVIRLLVKESNGTVVYRSSVVKIEMTRAKILDLVTVSPEGMHGANFEIKQFPPGDYTVDGVFSTTHLSNWKIPGLPIGSWEAPLVRFKVFP